MPRLAPVTSATRPERSNAVGRQVCDSPRRPSARPQMILAFRRAGNDALATIGAAIPPAPQTDPHDDTAPRPRFSGLRGAGLDRAVRPAALCGARSPSVRRRASTAPTASPRNGLRRSPPPATSRSRASSTAAPGPSRRPGRARRLQRGLVHCRGLRRGGWRHSAPARDRESLHRDLRSANVAFHSYAALTAGAANLLVAFGSTDQRERFARPMLAGRFTGTMCLSEPHAGSSLADIRCGACPSRTAATGSRRARCGSRAATTSSPRTSCTWCWRKFPARRRASAASRCSSCREIRVDDDGALGEPTTCARRLNHKMGWRGTVNCRAVIRRTGRLPRANSSASRTTASSTCSR